MKYRFRSAAYILLIFISPLYQTTLHSHHSTQTLFVGSEIITIKGLIIKMQWLNPHTIISLDVKDGNGRVVTWKIEADTPNTLLRQRLNRRTLQTSPKGVFESAYIASISGRATGNLSCIQLCTLLGLEIELTDGRILKLNDN